MEEQSMAIVMTVQMWTIHPIKKYSSVFTLFCHARLKEMWEEEEEEEQEDEEGEEEEEEEEEEGILQLFLRFSSNSKDIATPKI